MGVSKQERPRFWIVPHRMASLGFPSLWPPTQFLVGQSVLQLPQFQMVLFIVDYVSLLESNPVISCVTLFPRRHQQTFFMPHTENQQQTKAELGEPMSFTVVTCRSRNDTKKLRPQSPPQRG